MITLEKTLLSAIAGGCDECNGNQTVVETNDNSQNLLENDFTEIPSSSLDNFDPIFCIE